jgi:hypothetical protein
MAADDAGGIMKLYTEDNEAIPAVVVLPDTDPAPTGYSEIVDIEGAYKHGLKAISPEIAGWADELALRSHLKTMVYTKMQVTLPVHVDTQANWDYLTAAEKRIAAHYFFVGNESFLLEVENDDRYWMQKSGEYRTWSQEVRRKRADLAESILFMRMQNVSDAKQALADLNQIALDTYMDIDDVSKTLQNKVRVKKLNTQYIEGLEDEAHDGVVAVRDWISSTVGTPYENNGFMSLTFPFKGSHTSASVRDELLAALDGTY